jgi:hypothetical protein
MRKPSNPNSKAFSSSQVRSLDLSKAEELADKDI